VSCPLYSPTYWLRVYPPYRRAPVPSGRGRLRRSGPPRPATASAAGHGKRILPWRNRELGKHCNPSRHPPTAELSGSGERPLLTARDRCGPMLGARRGHGRRGLLTRPGGGRPVKRLRWICIRFPLCAKKDSPRAGVLSDRALVASSVLPSLILQNLDAVPNASARRWDTCPGSQRRPLLRFFRGEAPQANYSRPLMILVVIHATSRPLTGRPRPVTW
jgi:hypothetical protein